MNTKKILLSLLLTIAISTTASAKFWGHDNTLGQTQRAADGKCYAWQENDYYILWIQVSNGGQWVEVKC